MAIVPKEVSANSRTEFSGSLFQTVHPQAECHAVEFRDEESKKGVRRKVACIRRQCVPTQESPSDYKYPSL